MSHRIAILEAIALSARRVLDWDSSDCDDEFKADLKSLRACLEELDRLDNCPHCLGGKT